MYCPVCQKEIEPENQEEYDQGIDDGLIYVHDDIIHEDSDIEALDNGIN